MIKYTFKEMFHKKALFFVLLLTLMYLTLYGFGIKEAYEALPRVNTLALPIFSEFITGLHALYGRKKLHIKGHIKKFALNCEWIKGMSEKTSLFSFWSKLFYLSHRNS